MIMALFNKFKIQILCTHESNNFLCLETVFDQLKLKMNDILLPNTININTIKCYQIKEGFTCTESRISCQNFGDWSKNLPRSLKELCIQSIADNWEEYPKLDDICSFEDRAMLLNILPTNLPLEITVPNIKDNVYWKKCALQRWPHLMPTNIVERDMFIFKTPIIKVKCDGDNEELIERYSEISEINENVEYTSVIDELFSDQISWKQYYLENHVKEYLERLDPEEYEPEQIKKICDICGPFVKTLYIEELKCSNNVEGNTRIPLGAVLTGLWRLQELSVCFKQKYIGFENFNWGAIQLPIEDIKSLAKGLEKINLNVLRIINSGIEGNECLPILNSIKKYDNLSVLDFSYCSLEDEGAISVCRLITEMNIKELLLTDNNIGNDGAEAIAYILHLRDCTLETLSINMNPIGSKGGNLILRSILANENLKILDLSACNIRIKETIAEVIQKSRYLQELLLSNNIIGNEVGNVILNALNVNKTLRRLDLRMTSMHSELQQKINDKIEDYASRNMFGFIEGVEVNIEFSEKCRKIFEKNMETELQT